VQEERRTEVVEEDKTQKAGDLKSEVWRGLEENECLGKCEIVEAYLQGQIHGQTREREIKVKLLGMRNTVRDASRRFSLAAGRKKSQLAKWFLPA
jgi:hypothetical protein